MKSPGPETLKDAFALFLKGICMGSADIVPGVSGGTIALITGIYEKLLAAIRSVNGKALKRLLSFDIKGAIELIHFRFLIILVAGIGLAIMSLARVMHFLLLNYPVQTWGFFLGLIVASVFILGGKITNWIGSGGLYFILGSIASYLLMGIIPVSTPETLWFLFFSGVIAICAMILPGISGAFLLLLLGKYTFITGALKNPFLLSNLIIIVVFVSGCIIGLLFFARFLHFMLSKYHNQTLAVLTGIMSGSLRKIWPWKETLDSIIINGKEHVLKYENIIPQINEMSFYGTCALALTGFLLVYLIDNKTAEKSLTMSD